MDLAVVFSSFIMYSATALAEMNDPEYASAVRTQQLITIARVLRIAHMIRLTHRIWDRSADDKLSYADDANLPAADVVMDLCASNDSETLVSVITRGRSFQLTRRRSQDAKSLPTSQRQPAPSQQRPLDVIGSKGSSAILDQNGSAESTSAMIDRLGITRMKKTISEASGSIRNMFDRAPRATEVHGHFGITDPDQKRARLAEIEAEDREERLKEKGIDDMEEGDMTPGGYAGNRTPIGVMMSKFRTGGSFHESFSRVGSFWRSGTAEWNAKGETSPYGDKADILEA